jgi:hypothetical protein
MREITGAQLLVTQLLEELTGLRSQAGHQANIEALDDALESARHIRRCLDDVDPTDEEPRT